MKDGINVLFLLLITLVSAMGGLLFGYDWVVIGGAKPFYEAYFNISDSAISQGWVMSSALVGCLIGALVSGTLSDRFGRKKLLLLSAILFSISAFGSGAANSLDIFVLYRILGGFGIGIASVLSPMYIAEIAPAKIRGRFVAINQLTIVIGILLAQVINFLIAKPVPADASELMISESWNGQMGRRFLLLLGYGGLALIFTFFGGFYALGLSGIIMLVSVMLATSLYAMTLAPTTWVVLSEIFPNRVRGVAMSIATFSLWSACFILTYTFPILNKGLGASGTFWLYGIICLFGFFFVRRYLSETGGKSLEEIENENHRINGYTYGNR